MDIRDYTSLSENNPEENFSFVCSFNERMADHRQQHGFINQYLGDAIMAIFPGNAADALHAAIKMLKSLREFNVSRVLKKKEPLKLVSACIQALYHGYYRRQRPNGHHHHCRHGKYSLQVGESYQSL